MLYAMVRLVKKKCEPPICKYCKWNKFNGETPSGNCQYVPIEIACVHLQKGHVVNIASFANYSSEKLYIIHI